MCAYIAPLVAQCIMLAALLVRQQWLFALMIGSGCCATAATMVLTLLQSRPTSFDSGADGAHTPAHACDTINEDMVRACTGTTLERLLNMADDAAPFRTMCHMWARTACATHPPGCVARIGTPAMAVRMNSSVSLYDINVSRASMLQASIAILVTQR